MERHFTKVASGLITDVDRNPIRAQDHVEALNRRIR
jgi:hypothetical protein